MRLARASAPALLLLWSCAAAAQQRAAGDVFDERIDDDELVELAGHQVPAVTVVVSLDGNSSIRQSAIEEAVAKHLWDRCIRTEARAEHTLRVRVLAHRTNDGSDTVALVVSVDLLEEVAPHAGLPPTRASTWSREHLLVTEVDGHVPRILEVVADAVDEMARTFRPAGDSRCGGEPPRTDDDGER
jgi:hypothetical protein